MGNGKSLIHVLFSVASICALFFVGPVSAAAPVANDDSVTTAEDTAVTINALSNDTDADGDTLSVLTAVASGNGTATTDGSTVTFIPDADFTGSVSIFYFAQDTNGEVDSATVTVTVTEVNDAPVAVADTDTIVEDTGGVAVDVVANDTDPESDTLTVSSPTISSGDSSGTVTTDGTNITYTPSANFAGTTVINYTITDDGTTNGSNDFLTDSGTFTVTVTEVNDAPVAVADTGTMTEDDSATAFTVLSNDTDTEGGTLTVSSPTIASGDSSGTVTTNGTTVTYTPSANFFGTTVINYTITDDGTTSGSNDFQTASSTLTVTVSDANDAPVAVADTGTMTEDDSATAFTVLSNDTDTEGGTLTVSSPTIASGDSSGTVTTNGTTVTYTPSANFFGTTVINYTITDDGTTSGSNDFQTASSTLTVTVTDVNDAPVAVDDAVTLAASTNATAVDVVANDTDTEGGTLTVSSPTINSGDSSGTVTTDGSVLFFTPSTGVTGTTTISYTITDDGTTSGSDAFLTDSAILTLTVNAVSNTDPVATDDTATTTEDSAQITISPLTNDTDADSDALIVASVSTAGTGTVSTDGTDVFYTPALNFNGTEVLTYIVSDSVDGIDGLDTGTITVTVTEVNDAPTTSDPAADSTDENTAVTITVTTNANYVTDVESDTLTFQNYSVSSTNSGGTDGTVALSSDGTGLVFTPSGEGQYNAVISYTLTDDGTTNGASDPQTVAGQITVTVTDVNDVPVAVADTGSMTEDDTATAFNVVTNDTDAENDSLTVSSPTINSGDTSGGLVSTDGTNITYTPSANFAGTTTIIYTLTDDGTTGGVSSPASASGLLTVTVAAVNDAPVVTDATATVAEDSSTRSYPVTTSSTYSSDVDGDTLSITAASLAGDTSGTIDVSSGTTLDYTPGADFNGTATITYTVSDATTAGNDALTDSGTLTVTVTPVADDPITSTSVTYTASTISEDATNITITLVDSASLVDSDGDQLELFSLTLNNGGSFSVNLDGSNNWDGTVTYSPAANFSGDELFTYIVTDGTTQVTSTLTVPVAAGVNDAPVTTADTEEITEDTTTATSIAVLTNDTDPEGDTISLTNVAVTTTTPTFGTGPGTVTVNGNFVDYTPAAGFVGTEVITYTVTDNDAGGGGSNPLTATGTLTVNVTNINDAPVVTDPATNTTAESTQTTLAITTGNTYVTDAESDTLTITAANISSGDTLGTVDFSDGNNILYTPSTNFNGTTVIAYTINDDGTSIVSGVTTADPLSATGQVTVTVTADATNSAPVANSDSQTVLEDAGETIIGVLSNDTDSDSADTLSVTSVATGGTGSVRTDGTLVYYTPAANFAGTETLTYTVQDDDSANGGVGVLTASSTVIVNVLAVNDAPAPPSISPPDIASNGTTTITLFATLTDASDGDAIVLSNFVGGNGGTIVDNGDGTITYTPPADFSGDEIISFIITDSTGETTSTSITLTVVANVAPIVNSNAFSTVVENSTNNLIGILDNVTDTNTSDTLTITSVSSNRSGIVTLSADGLLVTYSPAAGFDGNEVLQFTVTDGTHSVVGFHTVIVSNLDVSAPAVSGTFPTTYVAGVGSNLTIGIVGATDASGSAYVTDDSNQLIVRLTGLPSYGTATTDGSSITYVSNSSALTTIDDEIKFEIFDGSNTTSEITIAINIVSANTGTCDPTAISLDDPSLNEGCTITPTGYRIPVFLFGLCTSEPTEPTTSSAYDLSNCSFFFDGTSSNDPATITFGGLNETTTFSGTLTIPDYDTYTHGVLLVGTDLEMKGSLFLSGSSTPYFVTGDYTNNIQGFATDVTEQFVDDDPIQFLYETGVYSYDFSDENVSVYMVDDSDVLVSTDGAATGILAIEKFSVPQIFSETTSSINIELGISDALIITNGTAASAPFSVGFTVQ